MDGTTHPVLRCADAVHSALDDAAGAAVEFMGTAEKRAALLRVAAAAARLEGLRLRLVAAAADVADEDGCRDAAAWLTAHTRTDRAGNARDQRLAAALDRRWPALARGLAEAAVNPDQARAIAHSLDALPAEAGPELRRRAEAHLVAEAAVFGPRELRVLGRRILDIVAPELGEETERRHLEDEERRARETTSLTTRRDGDGCTLIRIKVPDAAADRLLTYLDAHTSPRATTPGPDPAPGDTTADRPDPGPAQTGPAPAPAPATPPQTAPTPAPPTPAPPTPAPAPPPPTPAPAPPPARSRSRTTAASARPSAPCSRPSTPTGSPTTAATPPPSWSPSTWPPSATGSAPPPSARTPTSPPPRPAAWPAPPRSSPPSSAATPRSSTSAAPPASSPPPNARP